MKKSIVWILCFVLALGLVACSEKKYKVEFADADRIVNELEEAYAAGEEVTIQLETITEHYYVLLVNGEAQEMDMDASDLMYTYFTFTMPAEDVVIEIEGHSVDIPEAPSPTPEPASAARDLNGLHLIIGDSVSPEVTPVPTTAYEEALHKYREELQKKHNFTFEVKRIADPEEMEKVFLDSVQDGNPVAHVFELDYSVLSEAIRQGLLYDLATLDELNFDEDRWSAEVREFMTRGDSIYGMYAKFKPWDGVHKELLKPGGGILWNKRLFEEAGLDPELPYELQASGEWTWSKFEEICEILTRDIDKDGQTDVYATGSDGADTLQCLVSSTGNDFLEIDKDGKIYNNCKDEAVLGAMEFASELYEKGYEMPAGAEPEGHITAFQEGRAAMQFGEASLCDEDAPYGEQNMTDAVGFVLPPKPDGQEEYHSYVYGSVWVIPSCYDAETAADIAFAYHLLVQEPQGDGIYEDPSDGLEEYYGDFSRFDEENNSTVWDERAVKETIARFNDGETANFLNTYLVEALDIHDLTRNYPFIDKTPEECVEELWDSWQELITMSNGGES